MVDSDSSAPNATPSALPMVLMTVAAGVLAANLYYLQPLFDLVGREFKHPASEVATAFTASQLGFATALLLLVPLVDLVERRALVLTLVAGASLMAGVMALSTSLAMLRIGAFALGVASVVPQVLVPLAASLASPTTRSRTIGQLMSGVLVGLLLARTVSGSVAAIFGWRAVFAMAALAVATVGVLLARRLPRSPAPHALTYRQTLATLPQFIARYPVLRNAALTGALTFAAFSMLWTGLALHLAGAPFHYGPARIGLFGLAGAAGVVIANLVGRLLDRTEPTRVLVGALLLASGSMLAGIAGAYSAVVLALVLVGFDIGAQAAHLANQTRIFRLDSSAVGRLNSVYMVSYFIGGSLGSWGAARLFHSGGWHAVAIGALALSMLATVNALHAARQAHRIRHAASPAIRTA